MERSLFMKAYVKWISVVLALFLAVFAVRSIGIGAEAASEASQDGVKVTISASKDHVAEDESLELTVTIINDSGKTLKPVSSQLGIPEGFELVEGQAVENWETLNPGGLITQKLTIKAAKQETEESSTEESSVEESSAEESSAEQPSAEQPSTEGPTAEEPHEEEDPPETGDRNRLDIIIPIMILSAAGMIVLLIKKKSRGIKYLALLIAAGAVLYALSPDAKAAGDNENRLEASYTFTLEGKTTEISVVVEYEKEEAPLSVTRSDVEGALAEIAWDFYMKGPMMQYDSNGLNTRAAQHLSQPVSVYYGGTPRTTIYSTIEDATSHTSFFTVCSGYCYNVYEEAIGYPLFGNRLNSLTMTMWRNSSTPDDMVILRWHDKGKGEIQSNYDITYGVTYEDWYEADEVFEFFKDYEHTLRVGDIIVMDDPGHAMLYVGNGVILDSNGGKYDIATGRDTVEADGTVDYNTIEGLFLNPNNTNFYVGNLDVPDANLGDYICVLRPLDILMKDDGDDDPGNDVFDPDYVLNTGKTRRIHAWIILPCRAAGL